jgi:hypothetical protein
MPTLDERNRVLDADQSRVAGNRDLLLAARIAQPQFLAENHHVSAIQTYREIAAPWR